VLANISMKEQYCNIFPGNDHFERVESTNAAIILYKGTATEDLSAPYFFTIVWTF
jgi:hypothetical protein